MWKSLQNWLFGKSKSEDKVRHDLEHPTTSRETRGPPPRRSSTASGDSARTRMTNVLQSSVVEARHSVIPSVTLLVLDDTADRITKVMDKLDSLELGSPEPQRKSDKL